MNRYHITIIAAPQDYKVVVVANNMAVKNEGIYVFYDADGNARAYYPCGRTMISEIEYGIEGEDEKSTGEKSTGKVTDLNNGVN